MEKEYDLFLFCGQSNMAGRGITSEEWPEEAPSITPGAGLEYRAISDPECLHPVQEPFGAEENNPEGIYEPGMKTGNGLYQCVLCQDPGACDRDLGQQGRLGYRRMAGGG